MDGQPYCIVCFAYHQLPDCLQFEPSSLGSALERYLPDTFLIGVNSGMYTCGLRNTSRQVNSSAAGKQRIGNCSVARCELLRLFVAGSIWLVTPGAGVGESVLRAGAGVAGRRAP